MSKRSNGEGIISLRGDGRHMYRWIDQDGRRRTGYARTRDDAVRALRKALERVEEGAPAVESADTFKATATRWKATAMVRHGLARRSLETYWPALRLHAFPVIGGKRMRDLKPGDVAQVLLVMEGKGLSSTYRNITLKAISNVCQEAVEDGELRVNPARKVKAPRPTRAAKVVPTREQVAEMIEAAPDARSRMLLVLLAHTGARIGEVLAVRWSDWNEDTGTLRLFNTKGDRPRPVPVTPTLAAELRAWRKAQTAERLASVWWDDTADLILSTTVGTAWDDSNARRVAFRPVADGKPATKDSPAVPGVCPGATPHSMRHAAATILLEEGVPMKVVSELLGHANTRTTAEIYSHVTARMVAEAGTAIERALG